VPTPLEDGALTLSGLAGHTFTVGIEHAGRSRQQQVVLTRSGEVAPRRLALEEAERPSPVPVRATPPVTASATPEPARPTPKEEW
jgi:hypothetical protein